MNNDARYNVEIKRLRKRLAELEAIVTKLLPYAEHGKNSDVMCESLKHSDYPCSCGLDDVVKSAAAANRKVT